MLMSYMDFWKTVTYISLIIFLFSLLGAVLGETSGLLFGFTSTFYIFTAGISFVYLFWSAKKWKIRF